MKIVVKHEKSHGRHVYTARTEDKPLAPQHRETAEAAIGALIRIYPKEFGLEIEEVQEE
jgi:hypothetical protein